MKVLIVFAHPEPKSFNGGVMNKAKEIFEKQGHEVKVSDLYAMNFKAVAGKDDFPEFEEDYFKLQAAQSTGKYTDDIKAEQEKIEWADLLFFQFPLWWAGLPSILKGWFDRVFTAPWSYSFKSLYDGGVFKQKRAFVSTTTGSPFPMLQDRGINGNINQMLFPLTHGTLYFCGFQVLKPLVGYSVAHSEEIRTKHLEELERRLGTVFTDEPIKFAKIEDFEGGLMGSLKDGLNSDFENLRN